jgi:hypothetical protein
VQHRGAEPLHDLAGVQARRVAEGVRHVEDGGVALLRAVGEEHDPGDRPRR